MKSETRLRPGTPKPLRYQGGLHHYHFAPLRQGTTWDQWVGGKLSRSQRKFWIGAITIGLGFLALTAIISGLFIELS